MTELETMQRAKMYMDRLARGIDPITGMEIPEDSVLNNVRLARCFYYVSEVLERVIDNGGEVGGKAKPKKIPFGIDASRLQQVTVSAEPVRIGEFMERLYQAAGADPQMTKPSTTLITNWLLEKGFLYKLTGADGKANRVPTEAGNRIGILAETRQGQYGEYLAVFYTMEAQRFLLDNLPGILEKE